MRPARQNSWIATAACLGLLSLVSVVNAMCCSTCVATARACRSWTKTECGRVTSGSEEGTIKRPLNTPNTTVCCCGYARTCRRRFPPSDTRHDGQSFPFTTSSSQRGRNVPGTGYRITMRRRTLLVYDVCSRRVGYTHMILAPYSLDYIARKERLLKFAPASAARTLRPTRNCSNHRYTNYTTFNVRVFVFVKQRLINGIALRPLNVSCSYALHMFTFVASTKLIWLT